MRRHYSPPSSIELADCNRAPLKQRRCPKLLGGPPEVSGQYRDRNRARKVRIIRPGGVVVTLGSAQADVHVGRLRLPGGGDASHGQGYP